MKEQVWNDGHRKIVGNKVYKVEVQEQCTKTSKRFSTISVS